MPNLFQVRQRAYRQQQGRCIYCFQPMWLNNPDIFANRFKLSQRQVKFYQCTAEHLLSRQEDGKNSIKNIAAACKFCNQQRHRSKQPLQAIEYQQYVQNRVTKNRWPTISFLQASY